jgi:hypothetical protein
MDPDDLRYVGRQAVDTEDDVALRIRFAIGGQVIDAVVPQAAATVWQQTHPDASDDELEEWARPVAERHIHERLDGGSLDFSDIVIDRNVGTTGDADHEPPSREHGSGAAPLTDRAGT